eukprot:7234597-Ditylum_brightwellii.AAC.1
MVCVQAGNKSVRMAGVLAGVPLGTLSGVACGEVVGCGVVRCSGRMWVTVALCWARKVEEASTTIGGVTTCDWAPSVQAAVNMAQSGLMFVAMSNSSARLQSRGHALRGVSGTARTSRRRQNGIIAAF